MKRKSIDVTQFPVEMLNVALKMSLEWGENWLRPIQQRMKKLYPQVTAEETDNLNQWCGEVRKYAFALVKEEYPLAMANQKGTAMERVKQMHPQVDNENLSQLYNRPLS